MFHPDLFLVETMFLGTRGCRAARAFLLGLWGSPASPGVWFRVFEGRPVSGLWSGPDRKGWIPRGSERVQGVLNGGGQVKSE